MEHTEPDDHTGVEAHEGHGHRYGGAEHTAAQHDQTAAAGSGAQRDAKARQDQKHHAAPVTQKPEPAGIVPADETEHLHQIEDQVEHQHGKDTQAPEGIQLPDPLLHWAASRALASSSSTR